MRKLKFQSPSGMHDILPEDQQYFQKIQEVCENIANFYGFEKIDTPIVEEAELFSKGIGISTDIAEKEMYTLRTKGGDLLALRPEGTASVARAYIEHNMLNLPQPLRLWYFGQFFRHERPQAGRFRQFWQFGFEVFGESSPIIDAQVIQIFYNILKELKFKNLIVEVNSIGCRHCRSYYKKLLISYLKSREVSLCSNCRRRLRENPLRVLDCKEEKCQRIISHAPQMIDHLCDECKEHFKSVLEFLDELGLPYSLNPYLVRGLDYYTKTVFEIFPESLDKEQKSKVSALVGGGRYDNLVKALGGRDSPACGGSAGIERIIQESKESSIKWTMKNKSSNFFLAQLGELAKKKSLIVVEKFREAKIPILESLSKDSLKTQLGRADKLGAKYCLILGQKEALGDTIIIRDMKTGEQKAMKMDKVIEWAKNN